MNIETIIEGNKLIAEFMGFEDGPADSFSNNNYRLPDVYRDFLHCSHFGNLHFHSSYNWIMPVVEKIGTIIYHRENDPSNYKWQDHYSLAELLQHIGYKTSRTYLINTIETIWLAVTEFIQWHNKQNKEITS